MEFGEAIDKLVKLSGGRYCSVDHKVMVDSMMQVESVYVLYIGGTGRYTGSTWEEAFEKLEDFNL